MQKKVEMSKVESRPEFGIKWDIQTRKISTPETLASSPDSADVGNIDEGSINIDGVNPIIVATRPSKLATVQTQLAIDAITSTLSPEGNKWMRSISDINRRDKTSSLDEISFKILKDRSLGDRRPSDSLATLAAMRSAPVGGVFTKEIEDLVLDGAASIAVHSLKDLPSNVLVDDDDGPFVYPLILAREDVRDVVILSNELLQSVDRQQRTSASLDDLPEGAIIGTSAVRRRAFIRRNYAHLVVNEIRGNIDTRLQKLENKDEKYGAKYDALILAAAGLNRLKLGHRIYCYLDAISYPYSPGQGALICQCLRSNTAVISILQRADHLPTRLEVIAERQFMATVDGGCKLPIGVACQCRLIYTDNKRHGRNSMTSNIKKVNGSKEVNLDDPISCQIDDKESYNQPDQSTIELKPSAVFEIFVHGQIWSADGDEVCSEFQQMSCLISGRVLEILRVQNMREQFEGIGPRTISQASHHMYSSESELINFVKSIGHSVGITILNNKIGRKIRTELRSGG